MKKTQQKKQKPKRNNLHLLDQFSERDIRAWQAASDDIKEFWYRLDYHLLGLQQANIDKLCESLRIVQSININFKNWVRIIDYRYSLEPLSSKGSLINNGRFNIGNDLNNNPFPKFPALYIAEDYDTAYAEKFGRTQRKNRTTLSGEELSLRTPDSFSSIRINVKLNNVFDLTKANNLNKFVEIIKTFNISNELKLLAKRLNIPPPWIVTKPGHLKKLLMDVNWCTFPVQYEIPANSQIFARMLIKSGFEGIKYQSTKGSKACIAVFLSNLNNESFIELSDPAPHAVKFTKLDNTNWQELI